MSNENETQTALKTPEEWCLLEHVQILDADGWRGRDGRLWNDPITLAEFRSRLVTCTQRSTAACSDCSALPGRDHSPSCLTQLTTQPASEHHTGTLNLAGEGNANCPLAPHHHLMETCDCGYEYTYPEPDNDHRPIGIRSTDVGPFIRCSCGSNPSPHHWLAAHWPGDKAEGMRLADEVLARAREIGGVRS